MLSKQVIATFLLVIAALIWGTAFVAQTTGMEFIGPLTFTNLRFFIGAILILPLAMREKNKISSIKETKKNKLYLILFLTGCSLLIGSFLQQYALLYTKVGNAAF